VSRNEVPDLLVFWEVLNQEARSGESGGCIAVADLDIYRCIIALFNEKERALATLDSIGDAVISTDVSGRVTTSTLRQSG
jgi:hypothetical protein